MGTVTVRNDPRPMNCTRAYVLRLRGEARRAGCHVSNNREEMRNKKRTEGRRQMQETERITASQCVKRMSDG